MSDRLTDAQIDELLDLEAKATPGGWRPGYVAGRCSMDHFPHGQGLCNYEYRAVDSKNSIVRNQEEYDSDTAKPLVAGMWDYEEGGIQNPDDTSFIAASRNSIRSLLEEVKRGREIGVDLLKMGKEIVSDGKDNNHCTAYPIFMVQQKRRTFGIDSEFTENVLWQHGDEYTELPVNLSEACEAFYQEHFMAPACIADGVIYDRADAIPDSDDADEFFSDLRRIGYYDTWENMQPFFTETGAKRYISENGHNLKEPRIYVECAYRNREWQLVRSFLKSIAMAAIARAEKEGKNR